MLNRTNRLDRWIIRQRPASFEYKRAVHQIKGLLWDRGDESCGNTRVRIGEVEGAEQSLEILPINVGIKICGDSKDYLPRSERSGRRSGYPVHQRR